jgi:hypothetical protein
LTPDSDAALAGFVADTGHTGWALCFSSFRDDASNPSTFHAQCDQYDTTVLVARHGPVLQTGSVGGTEHHPEYDIASPAWVQGANWTFGGYVSAKPPPDPISAGAQSICSAHFAAADALALVFLLTLFFITLTFLSAC